MKKESIINIIAQFSMFAVNFCISFFFVPYITEKIGVSAYGFVGLANDFVGYAQIITIALNSMAARFITIKIHEKKIEEANKYYSSVIIANVFLSLVLGILGTIFIIFMDKLLNIPVELLLDVRLLFSLIFANFIISILTSTFAVSTFCTNKLYLSSIKTIISQIIRVIILFVAFMFFKPSVYYVGLAAVISTAYLGFCNYRYSKTLTPELNIARKYFNIKYVKTLIASGIWNTLTKLSGILSSGLDLLLTNIFIDGVSMGIIGLSKTVPNTILSAFAAITSAFTPELTISYANKNYEEMKNQLLFAVKLLGLFAAIPITTLFAYGDIFYSLWVPSQDAILLYSLTIITLIGLSFSLPLEPLWNLFTVTNKVKASSIFLLSNSVLTIIVVLLLIIFIPDKIARMFIIVSVSVVFTIIRSLTFLPLYGAKCINLKKTTFYPSIFKNLLAIIISVSVSLVIKKVFLINSWLLLIIFALISALLTFIISLLLLTNKEERIRLLNMIKNKFNKKAMA